MNWVVIDQVVRQQEEIEELRAQLTECQKEKQELALQALADSGQAMESYDALLECQKERDAALEEAAKACHDIQMEMRTSMYDDYAAGGGDAARKCWKTIRALKGKK